MYSVNRTGLIRNFEEKMYLLNRWEERLCSEVVDAAYKVHTKLGPGLLEKVYETCFCYELDRKGIDVQRQVSCPIKYDDVFLNFPLRIDVLVEESVICEIKAVDKVNPVWEAQLLTYLKLSGNHIGFRINFNETLIKNGIRRYCL